jgi:hypothetical protein
MSDRCRNSVDKRTVIENYDLVVRVLELFPPALRLTRAVARRGRARRRRHHPRDRPRHRRFACQQAARARHDLDEEHRAFGTRLLECVGVWQEAACREDTARSMIWVHYAHGVVGVLAKRARHWHSVVFERDRIGRPVFGAVH